MENIILIGMPGCGKSTVGVVLAKMLGLKFTDSDLLIQDRYKKLLSELISEYGSEGFKSVENEVNSSIELSGEILATGGSAVYGEEAMEHLKKEGTVVYLKLSYEEIKSRLGDLSRRGVVMKEGYTLRDVYDERVPLYEKYADVTVDCEGLSLREVAEKIADIYLGSR